MTHLLLRRGGRPRPPVVGKNGFFACAQNDTLVAKQTFFGTALEAVPYAGTEDCCFSRDVVGAIPYKF